jgi:ferredoxin--NADP+ reductase
VSFEAKTGIIPNARGRCLNDCDPVPGLYVTGWIKRGPTGIIGTNRADSVETVDCIIEDLSRSKPARKPGIAALRGAILERGARVVTYAGWQQIDAAERARGQPSGKPREKFTLVADMIALAETGSP